MKITEEDMAEFLAAVGDDTPNDHGIPERIAELRAQAGPVAHQVQTPAQSESPVNTEDTAPVAHLHQLQGGEEGKPPPLAHEPHILDVLTADLTQVGLIAERLKLGRLVFLVSVSRNLPRPVSLVVKGPSSAGKSWPVEQALQFVSLDAYVAQTAGSERSLVYDTEPLVHRHLVIAEAAGLGGEMGEYLIRSLLSEGKINYKVTVRGPDGGFRVQHVYREGPTGLISTTTAISLHPENETRFFSFTVTDTAETTLEVVRAWSAKAAGKGAAKVDYARWHELDRWLATGEHRVVIPFAEALGEAVSRDASVALRLKRDWIAILSLIQTHALLHRATRTRDSEGRIVATMEDYTVVREMVEPLVAEAAELSVSPSVREAVEAVRKLSADHQDGVPLRTLAAHLNLSESAASRRVKQAKKKGYLRNENEGKIGQLARLIITDELPDNRPVLPLPDAIGAIEQVALETPVNTGDFDFTDSCHWDASGPDHEHDLLDS